MTSYPKTAILFASESVSEGHPDKLCDQISDAILDNILSKDPAARVAVEVMAAGDLIVIGGEVSTIAEFDAEQIARNTIARIGYNNSEYGLDSSTCRVQIELVQQSPEIAQAVNTALEIRESNIYRGTAGTQEKTNEFATLGAGDQGLMFGYATDENAEYMPTPIALAHRLAAALAEDRKNNLESPLKPDAKTQVIIEYGSQPQPLGLHHILISSQHDKNTTREDLTKYLKPIVYKTLEQYNQEQVNAGKQPILLDSPSLLINPAGEWNVGGPKSDAGLTGRKIIVDTYGGYARHGGGNFHGKDPSKVDRSAAYALRWVAKNIVAAGLAKQIEIQISYAIGKAEPLSINLNTFGTHTIPENLIRQAIVKTFDLRPAAIIDALNLTEINNYQSIAAYGHFGWNAICNNMPWERLDKVDEITKIIKNATIR